MSNTESNNKAVSVYDEAKSVFWDEVKKSYMDGDKVLGRMSIHNTVVLFDKCVIPAIKKVRELDREWQHEDRK